MWNWRTRRDINAVHQKSIRIDDFTLEIIDNYQGRSFSDKLRNYVYDMENKKNKNKTC